MYFVTEKVQKRLRLSEIQYFHTICKLGENVSGKKPARLLYTSVDGSSYQVYKHCINYPSETILFNLFQRLSRCRSCC